MLPHGRAAALIGLSALLPALTCRSSADSPSPQQCAPVSSELPATSSAQELAGEYRLRLVATSGVKTGSAVEGPLKLMDQRPELRHRLLPGGATDSSVIHPAYGATEIELSEVDAVLMGSTTSMDPLQPGVLVVERHERPGQPARAEIVIRLGSEANRRDRQRVDGGYMALRVRQLAPHGFSGTWGSGITGERSGGYFCAVRYGKDAKGGKEG